MDRLSIDLICTLGMPPVDHIRMVEALGVTRTALGPRSVTDNPHGFPDWDLRADPALVSATKAALRDCGVTLTLGEGFLILPGMAIADAEPLLDLMAELGAPVVNSVCVEQDRTRAADEFARFAEMAAARGQVATLEFMPLMWPATIAEALDLIAIAPAAHAKLLLDSMHVFRSGASAETLRAIDPQRIGYIQICDVPMKKIPADYGEEARNERLIPGEGDLPLADMLRALPDTLIVGLETPMVSKAKAGLSPQAAMAPCVAAARDLLARVS